MRARAIYRWAVFAPLLIAAIQPAEAGGARVRTLTEAYNASGQALFRELARLPGNIVLSPYSIGAAMAMVRSGARGDTERQIASVLNDRQSREQTDAANAALLAILNSYDRSSQPGYCPKGAQWTGKHCEAQPTGDRRCPLAMQLEREACVGQPVGPSAKLVAANALMLTKRGGAISEEYKATVRDKYAAAIYEGARLEEVNGWVKQKTDGKIDQILDWLDPDAGSVLLNAVYLKAGWASAFVKSATRVDDFKLSVSERVRVPIMRQQASFRLEERVGYRAIRLDYTERSLGMIIVLPNEVDGLDMVTRELDASGLASLLAALKSAPHRLVALALARFTAAFKADLVPPFQKAGMILAFSDSADFSGMTVRMPVGGGTKIGAIRHEAVIEVTEQGTEAAAATAVVMIPRVQPKEQTTPIPFVVDRPFLFYVLDDTSGAIVFQGRIIDPRQ